MAVTQGRSAMKLSVAAVVAALRDTAPAVTLKVPTGHSALGYRVEVHGDTPQRSPFPRVRVDAAGEIPDSTMGRNGKQVSIYVQIFDDYEGDKRILEIADVLIAIMNPAGDYKSAVTLSGYRVDHVNFDGIDTNPEQEEAGKEIRHKTVRFTLFLEESS